MAGELLTVEQATEIAVGWYNEGEVAEGEGSMQRRELREKAVELLEQVVAHDASYAQASFLLAMMHQRNGEARAAYKAYAISIRADAQNADALNNMGKALADMHAASLAGKSEGSQNDGHSMRGRAILKIDEEAYYRRALAVNPLHRQATVNLALVHTARENYDAAMDLLQALVARDPSDAEAHYNLAFNHERRGEVMGAVAHYRAATATRAGFVDAWLNLAALHHRHGTLADAVAHYSTTMELLLPGELTATQKQGQLEATEVVATSGLTSRPRGAAGGAVGVETVGARETSRGDPDNHPAALAQWRVKQQGMRAMLVMVHNNLGLALQQQGLISNATRHHCRAALLLSQDISDRLLLHNGTDADEMHAVDGFVDTLIHTRVNLYKARKVICDWERWDMVFVELVELIKENQLHLSGRKIPLYKAPGELSREAGSQTSSESKRDARESALLPFDTLGADIPMDLRLIVASKHSEQHRRLGGAIPWPTPEEPSGFDACAPHLETSPRVRRVDTADGAFFDNSSAGIIIRRGSAASGPIIPLRIGYLSFDFNEHPTAHLVEGLFVHHKNSEVSIISDEAAARRRPVSFNASSAPKALAFQRVVPRFQALALSYGKHDNSTYRAAVQENSHTFVDLVEKGHLEATDAIRRTGTHILLDLQGHTLGGRAQIAARRAAPIQVHTRGPLSILCQCSPASSVARRPTTWWDQMLTPHNDRRQIISYSPARAAHSGSTILFATGMSCPLTMHRDITSAKSSCCYRFHIKLIITNGI